MVTASKEAVNADGAFWANSRREIPDGKLGLRIKLNNANDATIALAEAVGGTVDVL